MVEQQIRARGVRDERVLAAMREIPRHEFVQESLRERAYTDFALPIGFGQTISQPYIVAAMTEAAGLEPDDRVLEVGTGSGYQAAVLNELVAEVYSIEIVPELAERARLTLSRLGYLKVRVRAGDGYRGWPDAAPFDAIVVTAAPAEVPKPLLDQLALGGRLVIPVGKRSQVLRVLTRRPERVEERELFEVRFVPMTGESQAP
jgi:protein-L-isoaspartate(D-aspartate) O-methyltransferase